MDTTVVANYACRIGENPLWHPDEQALYWIDVPEGRLYRYDPATAAHELAFECEFIGGALVQADGSLLLFQREGRVATLRDGELTTLVDGLPDEGPGVAFNDAIADPAGRVFCGVRYDDDRLGGLYRLDPDLTTTKVVSDVELSNGLGFSVADEMLYYTDSLQRTVYEFDYDRETGVLADRRPFVTVDEDDGLPDGLTVDAEGYVWSAHAHNAAIVRYSPAGLEDGRIKVPVRLPTSVAFGGPDYRSLYVTTGGGDAPETHGEQAGALFCCLPDTRGKEQYRSRLGLET